MKISVSSYSFNQCYNAGTLNQLSFIQVAKDMGFDAVEFTDLNPHDGSTIMEYAKKIKAECDRLGMVISNYTIGADFLNSAGGSLESEIERLKTKVDVAEALGTKSMRHDASGGKGFKPGERKYRGFDDVLPIIAKGCREVTEYAATKGIRTMVENHGFFCQDSRRVEKLVNTVAHENFGLLCDMGNFTCADEDPAISFGRVANYAFYIHAKDFHIKSGNGYNPGEGFFQSRNGSFLRGAIIGHGDVPVLNCLRALKQADYDGYIGIEFEGIEDPMIGVKIGLANLRKMVKEVYGE